MPHSLDVVKKLLGYFPGTNDGDIENIEKWGQVTTSEMLRQGIISGLELRANGAPKTAESLIHLGCHCWGTAKALIAYCNLLQRLGEQYVFLHKEYCCAAGLICRAALCGDPAANDSAAEHSGHYLGLNIEQAKKLGAKNMYYCCTWCCYLARRFHSESEVGQHYYMDHVAEVIDRHKPILKLKGRVGYYGGGQHRRFVYVPGITWDYDWASYRSILDRIEGLEVVDVPKYCCVTHPDLITKAVAEKGISTLITPCMTCYGRMSRRAPDGTRVITIPQLLLEALDYDAPA